MRSKIFKRPEIAPIIRDSEIIRPSLGGRRPEETQAQTLAEEAPRDIPVEGVEPVTYVDAFHKWASEKLEVLISKTQVLEAEAIALQKAIIEQLDTDLSTAPRPVIEAANSLIDTPITAENPRLTECQLSCIAVAAGLFGDKEEDSVGSKLDDIKLNSENDLRAIENETKNLGPKVTGLWLFFFMVRFIVAFAVHVSIGFFCCYIRNKLNFKIGPFRVRLGEKIAKPIGELEIILKNMLGFPCGRGGADCLEPGQLQQNDSFRMFPCCQPNWESCGTSAGEADLRSPTVSITGCFSRMIEKVVSAATGEDSSEDGSKPCVWGTCEPSQWNNRHREAAKTVMDWILARSQAIKNSLSGDQLAKQYPKMVNGPDFRYSEMATHSMNSSRSSRKMIFELKTAVDENYAAAVKVSPCSLDFPENRPFGNLSSFGEITQDDIKEALKNNVDTSFVNELKQAEAERTIFEFDGTKPPIEPFKTIYEVVNVIDDTIGGILEELRKTLSQGKALSFLATDRVFCCVIYAIVVLGNLVRYKKLCPEKDLKDLFDYAQDFGSNKDVQNIIEFLRLLQKLIDAINADLLEPIEGVGFGTPLGTMLELLKKAIASSIVALIAMAIAPIDNALNALAANARIQALLNDNCFGIGDVFSMIHCGIKWIMDLIKKWVMELIPYKARNIEILSDFKITGFRVKFLEKFSDILKMLIDLLTSIGDCYPPEKIPAAIMDRLEEQKAGKPPSIMTVPPVPNVPGRGVLNSRNIPDFEDIGNEVRDLKGRIIYVNTVEVVIQEMQEEALDPTNNGRFPIFSEAVKIGFMDLVRVRNGFAPARPAPDVVQTDIGIQSVASSREQILNATLNMVKNLKSMK